MRSDNPSPYRWIALLLATLLQLGVSTIQQVPSALGPVLIRDLSLTRAQIGLLSAALWGGMLVSMLPFGILIDRFGERRVVSVGIAIMLAFGVVAGRSRSFEALFPLFFLASLGAASSAPGGAKALATWFTRSQRGFAIGVRQTGIPLGGLLAALLLPPVAVKYGWAAGLWLAIAAGLVSVVAFTLFYREMPAGTLVVRPTPTRPSALFKTSTFLGTTGYAFIFVGTQGCVTVYLALFLHEDVGLSVVASGAFLAALHVGGVAGRVGWGLISDRLGRRGPVMALVGGLAIAGCIAMTLVGAGTPLPAILALVTLLGFTAMGWNGLNMVLLAEVATVHAAGTAIGASTTISMAAMFIAPPLFGLIADRTGSYRLSWLTLAVWSALGVALAALIRERQETKTQPGRT